MFARVPAGADFRFFEPTEIFQQAARDQFHTKGGLDLGGEQPIAHMAAEARGLGETVGAIYSIDSANLPANLGLFWILNAARQPDIQAKTFFNQIESRCAIEAEQIALVKFDLRAVLIGNRIRI